MNLKTLLVLCAAAHVCHAAEPACASPLYRSPWAFQLAAADFNGAGTASVGLLRAFPGGRVEVVESFDNNFQTVVREFSTGTLALHPDCLGGEITYSRSGRTVSLDFRMAGSDEMLLTAQSNVPLPHAQLQSGIARRAPNGCPAGLKPIEAMGGDVLRADLAGDTAPWVFRIAAPYFQSSGASVATLRPYVEAGMRGEALGRLTGIETLVRGSSASAGSGPAFRTAFIGGSYDVLPDCSGGEIVLNGRATNAASAGTLRLQFVFAAQDFSEILFVHASHATGPVNGAAGVAKRSLAAGASALPLSRTLACPADPASLLAGSAWAFQMTSADFLTAGNASLGVLRTAPDGTVEVMETLDTQGFISRERTRGAYTITGDCRAGRFEFHANGRVAQIEFVVATRDELFLVSHSLRRGVLTAETGVARRAPAVCSSAALSGAWTFRLAQPYFSGTGAASTGDFTVAAGSLAGNETQRLERSAAPGGTPIAGENLVNGDCSGSLRLRRQADVQDFDFVLSRPDGRQMLLLNVSRAVAASGEAKRR